MLIITTGLLHFMRRLPLNLVTEMFFTAAPIAAEDAARWGIDGPGESRCQTSL